MTHRAPATPGTSAQANTELSGAPGRISCERCRRRKVKCDRSRPCTQCIAANVECTYPASTKKRPISRFYANALEEQVASLEDFILKLANSSHEERDRLLENYQESSLDHLPAQKSGSGSPPRCDSYKGSLLRTNNGFVTRIFGETSFYPIVPLVDEEMDEDLRPHQRDSNSAAPSPKHAVSATAHSELTPQSPVCQRAMSAFFQHVYYYHMVLYREYFLHDYKAGQGPFYSELLFYAIASMGALTCMDEPTRDLSDVFYERSIQLLNDGALNSPSITTVQALLLLGQREVGCGNHTQGWLFTGLSFRMVHEMGLHLDPNHWKTPHDSEVKCEVLRRVYWACFIADKQLSLYFGRPAALNLNETDVQDSVRIAYPPDWDILLNQFIMKDTTRTEYEDGVAFTSCFTQLANLSKTANRIITDIFHHHKTSDANMQTASTHSAFVALSKWLEDLPTKLHWNQWMKNTVPPYILHLHLYYHTIMILLCRPPRKITSNRLVAFKQSFETCEQSLNAILQLFKKYAEDYSSTPFPMTCLHTAATAVSTILLKLQLPSLSNNMNATAKQLEQISEVINNAASTWPAAVPIQDVVNDALRNMIHRHTSEESATCNWENLMTLEWQLDPVVELSFPIEYDEQPNFEI